MDSVEVDESAEPLRLLPEQPALALGGERLGPGGNGAAGPAGSVRGPIVHDGLLATPLARQLGAVVVAEDVARTAAARVLRAG